MWICCLQCLTLTDWKTTQIVRKFADRMEHQTCKYPANLAKFHLFFPKSFGTSCVPQFRKIKKRTTVDHIIHRVPFQKYYRICLLGFRLFFNSSTFRGLLFKSISRFSSSERDNCLGLHNFWSFINSHWEQMRTIFLVIRDGPIYSAEPPSQAPQKTHPYHFESKPPR